jgi:hypothetical protein
MRLWGDFAAEQPAMARLIVADVENEDRARVAVNEKIDKRLVRAEKMVTKGRKPGKVTKSAKVRIGKVAAGPFETARQNAAQMIAENPGLASFLTSDDPAEREMARKHVGL